ncbi:hypothetical protein GCM10023149_49220 [Mucilaginibacter gynuensis]|uniref:DUF983 domain-containing protein n=1 Tax=Mucilaginibacter gynuensis TaxID=1302236 RepID=A0ABP8HGJ0_9SPHI
METQAHHHNEDRVPVLKAAIQAKCPRCRKGDMFANSTYSLSGQQMHKTCPHCGMTYEREPGYFYVAMFVSYAMNVAQMVTLAVGTYILTGSNSPWLYVAILLGSILVLSPFNYRYSRVVLLYWLTPGLHYRPELSHDHTPDNTTNNKLAQA